MRDAADLIRAFAALLWPLIVFLLLITYRTEVTRLLRRIKRGKGKILGQELEFELDELESSATEAADETAQAALPPAVVPALPSASDKATDDQGVKEPAAPRAETGPKRSVLAEDDPVERVLEEARISPRLALVTLAAELERTMRIILAASQPPENWERRSLPYMIRRIELPKSLQRAVQHFYSVRSKVVHGHDVDEDAIIRTLDSGITLLSALRAIDYEAHEIEHPSVDVFEDSEGKTPREIRGVILRTYSRTTSRREVFPTRRTYEFGQLVTWEWDTSHAWPKSWYRDPDTNEVKEAWSGAAEFAGRPLEEVL